MPCALSSVLTSRGARRFDASGGERPQLRPDLLNFKLCLPAAHRQEASPTGSVLQDPLLRELPALYFREYLAHALLHALIYQLRTGGVVAVLGGVRDRVAHPGEPALVDEVHDELELVDALVVRELRLVARLDEGVESRFEERGQPA